jgi:ankyrin repeat protein
MLPAPSAPHCISSFSRCNFILLLFYSEWTALHFSAMEGRLEVCRLLLQCNADVGTMDATS